ncbi:MAG TPA: type VI secretion system accessory protein TagJ, partial [Longimicrobiales bacterium]|nr:type VI secretion system accessory protein TagJ [Longimicrobiales bacterium]
AAIEALSQRLREDPTDSRSRTFLFELLCFSGDLDRAERQLEVLARESDEAGIGAWMYRSALHAERTRREMFEAQTFPAADPPESLPGTLNGTAFQRIEDADPRIGARLEVFAAGQYTWIPFRHLASVAMEAPRRLRDLYWTPARVTAGPELRDLELGEVLLPAVTALAWQHPDGNVRLGRTSDVQEREDGSVIPLGPKILMMDDEPVPLLEVRELSFDVPSD